MAAAPSNFLSIVRPFFVLQSGVIAGPPEQRWLRPIDAGYRNELLAISRDPNVIGGNCNAVCAGHTPVLRGGHHRSVTLGLPVGFRGYPWNASV